MKTLLAIAALLLLSACQPNQHAGNGIQYHYQRTPVQLEMYRPSLYYPPVSPPQPFPTMQNAQPVQMPQYIPTQVAPLQLTPVQVRIVP
jgi:hypothetical protein